MNEDTVIMSMEDFADMQVREKSKPVKPKEVVEYTLEGVYIRTWESVLQVSRHYNLSVSTISNCCLGRYKYCHKTLTIFTYRGEDIEERLKSVNPLVRELSAHACVYKEVYEYTLGGRLLCKWPTAKMAAETNEVTFRKVHNCCKGKVKFVNKRIFLYKDDDIKQRVKEVKSELYRLSKKRPKYREVDEYTLEGKFVKGYFSASAASRELGIHVSNITRCCNGTDDKGKRVLTIKGRIFLWVGDSISNRLELIKQKYKR